MGLKSISQLGDAGALVGTEVVELSRLSATVTITAATISALAADNSYNDSGAGFVAAGFAAGQRVRVQGFTGNVANNIFVGIITALTAGKMTIGGADGNVIVDDAAGEAVTITKWEPYRTTLDDILAGLGLAADNDTTMAGDSTSVPPTQHAVRAYVALAVTGLLEFKSNIDCSANPNYPAANKGDAYIVSVAGKIGGAAGESVDVGDFIIASADNAGGTEASVGASWFVLEHNLAAVLTGAIASTTEQLTGTDNTKVSTPDSVAALWEQGTDVASAGTVALGEGGYFHITGTTGITDIDFATDKAGRAAWLKFAGILTLTNGANLILPTGANIVTAAGDTACFVSEGADVVRCVAYQRASGQPLAGGASTPTESFIIACSDETTALATGVAKVTFRMPYAFTLTDVRASLKTAQTSGSIFTVDLNEGGVSVLSTKVTIDNTEKTSETGVTAEVISDTVLANDAEMTVDIDQVGDGTAKGLKVVLIGHQ